MADPKHPERPDISKLRNTLERRAHLAVDMIEDRAQHIVDQMDEPPPGTEEPPPDQVRAMWEFSPYGPIAPQVFWMLHDAELTQLMSGLSAQQPPLQGEELLKAVRAAHQKAEMDALQRVYPHRVPLMLLGITTPERSIELAKKAQRLVEQDRKRNPSPQPQEALTYG